MHTFEVNEAFRVRVLGVHHDTAWYGVVGHRGRRAFVQHDDDEIHKVSAVNFALVAVARFVISLVAAQIENRERETSFLVSF